MPENRNDSAQANAPVPAVVTSNVVSPEGARVTERVVVLSERVASQLAIRAQIPRPARPVEE